MRRTIHHQLGTTLVEVMLAIALSGIVLPVMAGAFAAANAGRATSIQTLQASSLLREAEEATRSVREKGWSNVATDGTYHPAISGSAWTLVSGVENINGFVRQVVITSVQRNSSGAIVSSGGTVDPNTKAVTSAVAWFTPNGSSVSATTYLSRWQTNTAWTQTSQADFTGGTPTNTSVLASGDVQLQDSPATWQLPSVIGSYNITGNVAGNCVFVAAISGTTYAFVGYATGMAIVNVTNPAAPTLAGTFATSAAVNGIYVSGTTAYLATAITNAQLKIVNVATPATPTQTGTLQVGDTAAANAIYVSGTFAYVVKNAANILNSEFNIINVSNPAAPTSSGTLARMNANITGVAVNGNFAYISTSLANGQFKVINVTSKTAPTTSSTVNLGVTANDITYNGSTVYIATANNAASGELRIYNATTPTAPTAVGSYEVGGNTTGVDIDSTNANYVALSSQVTNKQAIIVDITTPATPTLVNNISLGGNANKIAINGSYAYLGTAITSQEMTIIYSGFRPTGTFESSSFDGAANVGLNALSFTSTVPTGSTLTFQVAANNTNSGWSYVGPDGTAGTSYSSAGAIPLSIASNRYFRYKASLTPTANGQQSPLISDVTLNYSP